MTTDQVVIARFQTVSINFAFDNMHKKTLLLWCLWWQGLPEISKVLARSRPGHLKASKSTHRTLEQTIKFLSFFFPFPRILPLRTDTFTDLVFSEERLCFKLWIITLQKEVKPVEFAIFRASNNTTAHIFHIITRIPLISFSATYMYQKTMHSLTLKTLKLNVELFRLIWTQCLIQKQLGF